MSIHDCSSAASPGWMKRMPARGSVWLSGAAQQRTSFTVYEQSSWTLPLVVSVTSSRPAVAVIQRSLRRLWWRKVLPERGKVSVVTVCSSRPAGTGTWGGRAARAPAGGTPRAAGGGEGARGGKGEAGA